MSGQVAEGKRVLVTGGAGFIGSNLADALAKQGHTVVVFDALARAGVERNLAWLQQTHGKRIVAIKADIRDEEAVAEAVRNADVVYHLAAQVAVTTSMDDPVDDFAINIKGTLNLLEAVRRDRRRIPVIFASTNKVYGDLLDIEMQRQGDAYTPADTGVRTQGVSETRPLDFHTPYGVSKGAADQYVLDYSRSFDIPTCVLRMSCIYGPRQMGTEDQGWVAHFLIRALNDQPISIYGDGCQVRDILHVNDAVAAYLGAWERIEQVNGRAFNLGGGPANAVSLRQVIDRIEEVAGRPVKLSFSDWRPGDQRYYVSDARAVRDALGLPAFTHWREGLQDLADWLKREHAAIAASARVKEAAA